MNVNKVRIRFKETISTVDECFRRNHEYDLPVDRAHEFRNVSEVVDPSPPNAPAEPSVRNDHTPLTPPTADQSEPRVDPVTGQTASVVPAAPDTAVAGDSMPGQSDRLPPAKKGTKGR